MMMPEDFLAAPQQDPAAHAFYTTLKRQSKFTINHRLLSATRSDTRQKRMAKLLAKLGRGADVSQFPKLAAHKARMVARPAHQRALAKGSPLVMA